MTIDIGFLGAGFISDFHVAWLAAATVPYRIAAVHDIDAERSQRFARTHGARVCSAEEIVDTCDAVYVTTWTSEHPRLVALAAEAGRPVFCEKPLGVDGDVVASMVDTVERLGVANQVGLVLRFVAPCRLVRHLVADERAGRPLAVVFRDDQYIPIQGQYASTWRADPAKAGRGTMLEHSIHDIDVLRWWLGPIASVSATTRHVHGLELIEDVAAVRFDFDNGCTGTLVSVWHDILERASDRYIEIICERLHIAVENELIGPVRFQFAGEPEVVVQRSSLHHMLADYGDAAANPAQEFLLAVAEERPAAPNFAEALPAHRVVDAIYRSADRAGAVIHEPELVNS